MKQKYKSGDGYKMEKMNKKGIFFTLIAISIISLFFISYTFYENFNDRSSTRDRVSTLNSFIFSIEEDIERKIFISGFRALFVMQSESVEQGSYIPNANYSLNELFFNGTFNGESFNCGAINFTMCDATFLDIQNSIQRKANKVNADIFLTNPSIYLTQSDPWYVDIVLKVNLDARDQGNLVAWNKTETYTAKVPINDFEDPLYLISTSGVITNKIEKTQFTNFTISSLSSHVSGKYYKASSAAPSYLNRLQGSYIADPNGIESFAYIPQLSNQGITIQDKSTIDYIYFSSNNPTSCRITGMPSWFKIDQAHLADYNLTGLEHSCSQVII